MTTSATPTEVAPEHDCAARIFSRCDGLTALVRTSPAEPDVRNCDIHLPIVGGSKMLNFKRKSNDQLSQVIQRMRISCGKALNEMAKTQSENNGSECAPKKVKGQSGKPAVVQPDVQFISSTKGVLDNCTLGEALALVDTIIIDDAKYSIITDPPVCVTLEIATELFEGFPVSVDFSVVGALESEFQFEYRFVDEEDTLVNRVSSTSSVFVPSQSNVGYFLEVRCFHPSCPQFYLSTISREKIKTFANAVNGRASRLDEPLPAIPDTSHIRVSTFNILAQPYIRTPLAIDVYYTHLHKCWQLTEWSNRFPLILREMLDTNSDIYCLQEVAGGANEQSIKRALGTKNFDWHYFGKASAANSGNPIGVVIAVNLDKFTVVSTTKWELGHGQDSLLMSMLTEEEIVNVSEKFGHLFFSDVLKGINTVVGVVHVRTKEACPRDVLIANTHLFFHPYGGHIRVLQGLCLMRAMAKLRRDLATDTPAGVIVCGDFNSRPMGGSFQVMHTGEIKPEHWDWQYGKAFRYDRYEAKNVGMNADPSEDPLTDTTLSLAEDANITVGSTHGIHAMHDLSISHVPAHIPELTHATAEFRATLDYVFFTDDTFDRVEGRGMGSSIPPLTNAEVDSMGGLPFGFYGSDHVLVCGDLKFKL